MSSLRANIGWAFAGNVVYVLSQWGLMVVLTRLGTPEQVGTFALGLALTAPLMMLANLNLRAVQVTDARNEATFGDYMSVRLVTTGLALVVMGVIVVARRDPGAVAVALLLFGVAKAIEALSDVVHGFFQQRERMRLVAISLIAKGALSFGAFTAVIATTGSLIGAVAAMAASWAAVFVAFDLGNLRALARSLDIAPAALVPHARRDVLRTLVRQAFPLGITGALLSLTTNIPRYVLESTEGAVALGVFANLSYLILAGSIVVQAIGQAASPRLARAWQEGREAEMRHLLGRLFVMTLGLGLLAIAICLVAGGPVLRLLFGDAYGELDTILVWVMLGGAVTWLGSVLGYAAGATRQFHLYYVPYAVLATVSLLASLWLVPRWGLEGAAWASIVIGAATLGPPIAIVLRARRLAAP